MVGKRPGQNPSGEHSLAEASPDLLAVLESASRLQQMVPYAVLVGRSAAALYAGHRDSYDHDHVLADLRDRFDVVLEALESEGGPTGAKCDRYADNWPPRCSKPRCSSCRWHSAT